MKLMRFVVVFSALALAVAGCDSGGGDSTATSDVAQTAADASSSPDVAAAPVSTCAFDVSKEGRKQGGLIKNFSLKTNAGTKFELHDVCSADTKVVWLVLATGWCGACEYHTVNVEPLWQQYGDKGLQVVWILGEDEDGDPVSLEWIEEWMKRKEVSFPVMRDYKFLQTYGAIEPHSSALPHQYIIDGRTMELLEASGGINEEAKIVEDLLTK